MPIGLFIPVFVQGAIISLVCLSVCLYLYVCVTFVVFTDCESCARANCTDSDSIEPGEYELTRGTFFIVRRPEVLAVAGLL